jgi:hypothetical protein
MPSRLSKTRRKKLSAAMKRKRADPAFAALHRAAMQRLNADPEFAAARLARIERLNADPGFRAKQRASRAISVETRAAIVAALRADPNAWRVALSVAGASYTTVRRIAKAEGVSLKIGGRR